MRKWNDERFYPRSTPRPARGGIRSRSRRGAFGENWWARRWIEVLEGFDLGPRLQRGRSYARDGQVTAVRVEPGVVRAEVQGSRERPYGVTIALKPLPRAAWRELARTLAGRAVYAAKLLGGEMPPEVEGLFEDAGLPLFPRRHQDLKTACTCPDWANPCKHVAAVYYLLAEELDRDPFILLRLRGIPREDLLALLRGGPRDPRAAGRREPAAPPATVPLPVEPDAFWGRLPPAGTPWPVEAPARTAALLRRLGPFPFWRGARGLVESLEGTYRGASERGTDLLAGPEARGY